MHSSSIPPRQVKIGDAALFAGTTPRAIRHYHEIGLLPEPARGSDDRRRYGYEDMIRLLWIRKMADAGIALDDIRDAFTHPAPAGADGEHDVAAILERLEGTLVAREAELQRQRMAVERIRVRGSRMGLLSDVVASRLESLPEGSMRQADLDNLLVMERVFGPLGAAVNATRYIAFAIHPGLREESDRVDAAEAALDDTVAIDDPRIAQVAAERHAFDLTLQAVIEDSGLARSDEALFDAWENLHGAAAGHGADAPGEHSGIGHSSMSLLDAVARIPYDVSPARVRCMELADKMAADAERLLEHGMTGAGIPVHESDD